MPKSNKKHSESIVRYFWHTFIAVLVGVIMIISFSTTENDLICVSLAILMYIIMIITILFIVSEDRRLRKEWASGNLIFISYGKRLDDEIEFYKRKIRMGLHDTHKDGMFKSSSYIGEVTLENLEAIYPFKDTSKSPLWERTVDGIQIETKDKSIGWIYFDSHPKDRIMRLLSGIFKEKWKEVYKEDEVATWKDGTYLIHHNPRGKQ